MLGGTTQFWASLLHLSSIPGECLIEIAVARKDPDEGVFDEIVGSKDPTIFPVFLEDSAGLIGTVLTF